MSHVPCSIIRDSFAAGIVPLFIALLRQAIAAASLLHGWSAGCWALASASLQLLGRPWFHGCPQVSHPRNPNSCLITCLDHSDGRPAAPGT
eukprot:scaffold165255_cov20-Tisochrysis_lutea.AAC.3